MFDASKVVKDLRLLAEGRVRRHRFAGERNRSRGAQVFRENKSQQATLEAQQCNLGVLHPENLGKNHTQIESRYSLAQH